MANQEIEPGVLRVFRWYALFRALLSAVVFIMAGVVAVAVISSGGWQEFPQAAVIESIAAERGIESQALVIYLAEVVFLLAYTFWRKAPESLKHFYLPLGLLVAAGFLLVEDRLFSPSGYTQPIPFLTVLLILAAWQYNFRQVALFTLATILMDLVLIWFNPSPAHFAFSYPIPAMERYLTYGRLVARLLSFLTIGYVVTSLMAAQRKQRQELEEAHRRTVRHAAALEQLAVSRERVRLSRELHDTLAHTLSALAVQIDAITTVWKRIPVKAQQMLDQMLQTTRTGLDETRRAMSALRASPLDQLGLSLALRGMAEDFASRCGLELTLDIQADLDDPQPEVEQSYFRVAQEAFENIGRHANAKAITVMLHNTPRRMTLTIEDDGIGFSQVDGYNEHKLGLQGMHERALLIGADLNIQSRPGEGTRVQLTLEMGQ